MPRYSTANHSVLKSIAWEPEKPAERINDYLLMSRSTSNTYLIHSDEGDLLINAGTSYQGVRSRERFEELLERALNIKHVIFTQSHPDHIGGWAAFAADDIQTHVQKEFVRICRERDMLGDYFMPRATKSLWAMTPKQEHVAAWYADTRKPEPLSTFSERSKFSFAGREYQLLSVPSGETLDSLLVWMPNEKIVFTGNFLGAIQGALPNFYTARGDRQRSVGRWFEDIELLLSLNAEVLVTGHDNPIIGATTVNAYLSKIRDAIRHIHDETVKGMAEQKSLWALMADIQLPAHLTPSDGRCPTSWIVRAIWEEYTGWFRAELTSELYATPPQSIWPELATMAGGVDALVSAAKKHLAQNNVHRALHFIEIAISAEPTNKVVRAAEVEILEALIETNGGAHFDELGWLESAIKHASTLT